MNPLILTAVIHGQHQTAGLTHLVPIDRGAQGALVAGRRDQMGIVQGAAEAASDRLRRRGRRQTEVIELAGNARQDTALGGQNAGDPQGQALDRVLRNEAAGGPG
jgi:hypothetical protein